MILKQSINKVHPRIRDEASEWFIANCEREVDSTGRQSFDRWLRTSSEHVRAYLQIASLWEGAGLLAQNTEVGLEQLVRRALSEPDIRPLSAAEISSRDSSAGRTNWQRPIASTSWRNKAIAACMLVVSAIAGGTIWWQLARTPTYGTGAAEHRTLRLPDGSNVQLNARSRIELHFTAGERVVELTEGQALFSVAKNPARPFIVRSDDARVRAVGTQFDVYRKSSGTIVTVIEGQVAIRMDGPPENSASRAMRATSATASPVLVSAGEQTVATSRVPMHAYRTNVFAATAWTEGNLVFDSTSLRDVVAEFNRVGSRRLIIEDDSLLGLHLSGAFPSADPSRLVGFLQQRFGVVVTETDKEIRVMGAAHK